jgi:hypothetical protein
MTYVRGLLVPCLLVSAILALGVPAHAQTANAATPAKAPSELAFRDHVDEPPPGWTGPVFKLSHDYPRGHVDCPSPWLKRKVDFKNPRWVGSWELYLNDVIQYVKQGQEPDLPDNVGWRTEVGGQARWFHVPWMAYDGQRGREFVHGLTNELSTAQSVFRPGRGTGVHTLPGALQTENGVDPLFETWSVGFYNPCGAKSIGEQWPASGEPATYADAKGRMFARGMPFPEGTVVVKILNSTAEASQVPYLKGSTTWQANGHVQSGPVTYSTCERQVRKVHLVQMDIAVVDARSPTRWVYTTLAYDGKLPGKTVWDRMKPIGVQFGSDNKTFPAAPESKSHPLHETLHSNMNIPEHYGCNGRLAGIVDQANSSCVSCHMGAYAAPGGVIQAQGNNIPAIFGFTGMCTQFNEANHNYFSDYKYPSAFPGSTGAVAQAMPLDSSLQLQVAFAQYGVYKNPLVPRTCPDASVKTTAAR